MQTHLGMPYTADQLIEMANDVPRCIPLASDSELDYARITLLRVLECSFDPISWHNATDNLQAIKEEQDRRQDEAVFNGTGASQ